MGDAFCLFEKVPHDCESFRREKRALTSVDILQRSQCIPHGEGFSDLCRSLDAPFEEVQTEQMLRASANDQRDTCRSASRVALY